MTVATDPSKTGVVALATRTLALATPAAATPAGTGSTVETTLATYTIPANTVRAGQALRVKAIWSMTSSANTKTARIKLGGTIYNASSPASSLSLATEVIIFAKTSASQIGPASNLASGAGSSNAALITSTADFTGAVDITFTGEVTTLTETVTLQAYLVELIG